MGGVPQKQGKIRKNALGEPGTHYIPTDIEDQVDDNPEYDYIDAYKAESFKNFHQDER